MTMLESLYRYEKRKKRLIWFEIRNENKHIHILPSNSLPSLQTLAPLQFLGSPTQKPKNTKLFIEQLQAHRLKPRKNNGFTHGF